MVESAIKVQGIKKSYGQITALKGVDLEVPKGTILGLLGPNGAGKTTLVRILATLLPPDSGEATVAGFDLKTQAQGLRSALGLSGQFAAIDNNLTGQENLELVGNLYHLGKKESKKRATELLSRFNLTKAANRLARTYSGGMIRRLDLALSLVAYPEVLFLDEPTNGLDPKSRMDLWQIIKELVADGTTLLLTTQYLEEADRLADNIVVIDQGKIIAQGTPAQLKQKTGGEMLEIKVADQSEAEKAMAVISPLGVDAPHVDQFSQNIILPVSGGSKVLMNVIRSLDNADIEISDIILRHPTLDDVFLELTGHGSGE